MDPIQRRDMLMDALYALGALAAVFVVLGGLIVGGYFIWDLLT